MRQLVALVGLALALGASAACEAHAGVKVNNPSVRQQFQPAAQQVTLGR